MSNDQWSNGWLVVDDMEVNAMIVHGIRSERPSCSGYGINAIQGLCREVDIGQFENPTLAVADPSNLPLVEKEPGEAIGDSAISETPTLVLA